MADFARVHIYCVQKLSCVDLHVCPLLYKNKKKNKYNINRCLKKKQLAINYQISLKLDSN